MALPDGGQASTGEEVAALLRASGVPASEAAATIFGGEESYFAEIFRGTDGAPLGLATAATLAEVRGMLTSAGIKRVSVEG